MSALPATRDWCADRGHPWVTYNPQLDSTWCRCGAKTEPGELPMDWDAKWETFHNHKPGEPCPCYRAETLRVAAVGKLDEQSRALVVALAAQIEEG